MLHEQTLGNLVRTVRRRVAHASDLIARTDDAEIIDREMRYVSPFWAFCTARQRINNSRYWKGFANVVLPNTSESVVNQTQLVWMPRRELLCESGPYYTADAAHRIVKMMFGVDLVLYNFMRLISRMRSTLGIESGESFQISTAEPGGFAYVLQWRSLLRKLENGSTTRMITCRFRQPDNEEIKIEKDMSTHLRNPWVTISLHRNGDASLNHRLVFEGSMEELKSGDGGTLRIR